MESIDKAGLPDDPDKLAALCRSTLEEFKGHDIVTLDLRGLNSFTDIMMLCSGTSRRHVSNLGNQMIKAAKARRCPIHGVEGQSDNEWVAIDLGSVVVHLMLPDLREYYAIERIWQP